MKTTYLLILMACVPLILAGVPAQLAPSMNTNAATPQFIASPIGRIEQQAERTLIRLDPRFQKGLLGLEQWSHIWVIYWFDRNDTPEKRAVLQVHPRGNPENPRTGVFATRSPMRPNLIALSLCRVRSVKDNVIEIDQIDAFDQTPVLDIKPYAPGIDRPNTDPAAPTWTPREGSTNPR